MNPYRTLPLIALTLFFALALYQLDLPGLHYDEAREGGVPAMQIALGQPVEARRDATVTLWDHTFPLMVQDYIGALEVVLAAPLLATTGIHVWTLRLTPVLLGALSVALSGALARALYGLSAQGATMLWVAVQPAFVFWSRQGFFVTNITAPLGLALALCLLYGHRTGRVRWWLAAAICAGLGVYAKLLFVWLLGALGLVSLTWLIALAAWPTRATLGRWLRITLAAAVLFVLMLSPLLLFNARTGGMASSLLGNLTHSYYGVNNLAFIPNLGERLGQLTLLFSGATLWYLGGTLENTWSVWLYGAASAAILIRTAWRTGLRALLLAPAGLALLALAANAPGDLRAWATLAGLAGLLLFTLRERTPHRRALLLPLTVLTLVVAQSCFTVSDLFVTHYALITPWLPLALAPLLASSSLLADPSLKFPVEKPLPLRNSAVKNTPTPDQPVHSVPRSIGDLRASADTPPTPTDKPAPATNALPFTPSPRGLLIAALIALPAILDARITLDYHALLTQTGGLSTHNDAIYRLATALQAAPGPVVALDWGFAAQLQFLSAGALAPIEVFGYDAHPDPDPDFAARLAPWLARADTRFVLHLPQETVFERRAEFDAARTPYPSLTQQRFFSRRDGAPMFEVLNR